MLVTLQPIRPTSRSLKPGNGAHASARVQITQTKHRMKKSAIKTYKRFLALGSLDGLLSFISIQVVVLAMRECASVVVLHKGPAANCVGQHLT